MLLANLYNISSLPKSRPIAGCPALAWPGSSPATGIDQGQALAGTMVALAVQAGPGHAPGQDNVSGKGPGYVPGPGLFSDVLGS